MLHSLELKRELAAIRASLKKKVENQEPVSAEEQQRLQAPWMNTRKPLPPKVRRKEENRPWKKLLEE